MRKVWKVYWLAAKYIEESFLEKIRLNLDINCPTWYYRPRRYSYYGETEIEQDRIVLEQAKMDCEMKYTAVQCILAIERAMKKKHIEPEDLESIF